DGVGDPPVVHDDDDAAGESDDEGYADDVAHAGEEGIHEALFPRPRNQPDENCGPQEEGGHLAHPPVVEEDAPDHDYEGEGENAEDDPVQGGEIGYLANVLAGEEMALELFLAVMDERAGGVAPHLLCISHDVKDAGEPAEEEDDEAQAQALGEGNAGSVRGDHRGEGIEDRKSTRLNSSHVKI